MGCECFIGAAGGHWCGRITRERSPASPAPRKDPPALPSQRRRSVSTHTREVRGGARARGVAAAHEGGRTLGQRIDDAGPLEIPPELLLLRVRALRCAGGARQPTTRREARCSRVRTWKAALFRRLAAMAEERLRLAAAQSPAGALFLPVRWSTPPPAAASGRVRARPPSSPVRHPSIW